MNDKTKLDKQDLQELANTIKAAFSPLDYATYCINRISALQALLLYYEKDVIRTKHNTSLMYRVVLRNHQVNVELEFWQRERLALVVQTCKDRA